MQKSKELTPSEQRWLRHLRRTQEQGVTLVDYARPAGVKVGSRVDTIETDTGALLASACSINRKLFKLASAGVATYGGPTEHVPTVLRMSLSTNGVLTKSSGSCNSASKAKTRCGHSLVA